MLGLGWPHERIDENGTPTSFKIFGAGRNAGRGDIPVIEDLLTNMISLPTAGQRLEKLSRMSIMLFRDAEGTEPISAKIPAKKWLAFQTDRDARRYCLHDGRWYLLDEEYAAILQHRTQEIFDRDHGLGNLPEWPGGADEAAYNKILPWRERIKK